MMFYREANEEFARCVGLPDLTAYQCNKKGKQTKKRNQRPEELVHQDITSPSNNNSNNNNTRVTGSSFKLNTPPYAVNQGSYNGNANALLSLSHVADERNNRMNTMDQSKRRRLVEKNNENEITILQQPKRISSQQGNDNSRNNQECVIPIQLSHQFPIPFFNRFQCQLDDKQIQTKYEMNTHAQLSPQGGSNGATTPTAYSWRPFSPNEDGVILNSASAVMSRWTPLLLSLPGRNWEEITSRYMLLQQTRATLWTARENALLLRIATPKDLCDPTILGLFPGRSMESIMERHKVLFLKRCSGIDTQPPPFGSPLQYFYLTRHPHFDELGQGKQSQQQQFISQRLDIMDQIKHSPGSALFHVLPIPNQ